MSNICNSCNRSGTCSEMFPDKETCANHQVTYEKLKEETVNKKLYDELLMDFAKLHDRFVKLRTEKEKLEIAIETAKDIFEALKG